MVARVWILRQTKDSSDYAGGLDQGRYGKAKCKGNGSQNWILEQTKDSSEYAGGLDQGRYGRAKCYGNVSQSMDYEAN